MTELIEFSPEVIASTAYLFNIEALVGLFKKISLLLPEASCIFGGPEFLGDNRNFLENNKNISCVFRGDESSFPDFLKNYDAPALWHGIKGICYIDSEKNYIDNGAACFAGSLDDLPSPYEKGYFQKEKPFVHYETARGCVSKCSFCVSSLSGGVKFHGLRRIESDLKALRDAGIMEIRILDRTFNVPEKRAAELIGLFSNKFSDMKFHIEIDPARLKEEVINGLNSAPKNQFHLELGIQSFNKMSLEAVNRRADIKKVIGNLELLTKSNNCAVHTDIIAGLPNQKYADLVDDVFRLVEIGPAEIQLEILKILPGTPIANNLKNQAKWNPLPPYEVLCTPDISFGELSKVRVLSRILDCYYNIDGLRNLFRFAAARDRNFLSAFLEFAGPLFSLREKPSLTARLNSLSGYAKMKNDSNLEEMVSFSFCFNGCPSEKMKNIRLLKGTEKDDIKRWGETGTLWKTNMEPAEKPVYLACFSFNAGDLFLNPFACIKEGCFRYLFYYSKFGLSGKSAGIDFLRKSSKLPPSLLRYVKK